MKNLLQFLATTILFSVSTIAIHAQRNEWKKIGDENGVSVYWRWKQLYRNSFVSEIKLDNSNSYPVEVTVLPAFTCPDGIEYKQGGVVTVVDARSSKSGEADNLAFYPCQGEKVPRKGVLEKFKVNKRQ